MKGGLKHVPNQYNKSEQCGDFIHVTHEAPKRFNPMFFIIPTNVNCTYYMRQILVIYMKARRTKAKQLHASRCAYNILPKKRIHNSNFTCFLRKRILEK